MLFYTKTNGLKPNDYNFLYKTVQFSEWQKIAKFLFSSIVLPNIFCSMRLRSDINIENY